MATTIDDDILNYENSYDFKEVIEMALTDCRFEDEQIYEINEIVFCLDIDSRIVHEDDWSGEKPEHDIELFGEHWFLL
jgi:hypothetical protein